MVYLKNIKNIASKVLSSYNDLNIESRQLLVNNKTFGVYITILKKYINTQIIDFSAHYFTKNLF